MKSQAGLSRALRAWNPFRRIYSRLLLSRAKHASLQGHPILALRLAHWLPAYHYSETAFFLSDSPPAEVEKKRREGFERLTAHFQRHFTRTVALSETVQSAISDLA